MQIPDHRELTTWPGGSVIINYPDLAIGSGKYDKGRATTAQQRPATHHKATPQPDPDPARQIQVGNHLIWIKNREQSENFRAAPSDPRVSPKLSYFNTWILRKTPEEQDPVLQTGTQGEEFSTGHGSSGDPLCYSVSGRCWEVGSSKLADYPDTP
ncbi:hypothetical protein ON010_g15731 [Phytophthora cinnamomi]|nr:hypothetical protein ON010_g15731 [Phytophthora cinnamomi]